MGTQEWTPDDTPLDAGTRAVRRNLLSLRISEEVTEQLAPLIADDVIGAVRPTIEKAVLAAAHATQADIDAQRQVYIDAGIAEGRHDALCWIQPDDGRLVACDRARDHKGPHSWDDSEATARERQRIREYLLSVVTVNVKAGDALPLAPLLAAIRDL